MPPASRTAPHHLRLQTELVRPLPRPKVSRTSRSRSPAWDKATALAALNIREENFTMLDGNAQGYATGVATVAVSPVAAMPEKTLFHEIAHVILGHHSGDGTELAAGGRGRVRRPNLL